MSGNIISVKTYPNSPKVKLISLRLQDQRLATLKRIKKMQQKDYAIIQIDVTCGVRSPSCAPLLSNTCDKGQQGYNKTNFAETAGG